MKKYTLVCDVCGKEMVASTSTPLKPQFHLRVGLKELYIDPADVGLMGSDTVKVLVISDICPSCYKDIVFEEANKLQEG
jgi:hypothetical protein